MKTKHYTRITFILIALIFTSTAGVLKAQTVVDDPHMGIIPAPASVTPTTGKFVFSQKTPIKATHPKDRTVTWFKNYLADDLHFHNAISKYSGKVKSLNGTTIILTDKGAEKLPKEG